MVEEPSRVKQLSLYHMCKIGLTLNYLVYTPRLYQFTYIVHGRYMQAVLFPFSCHIPSAVPLAPTAVRKHQLTFRFLLLSFSFLSCSCCCTSFCSFSFGSIIVFRVPVAVLLEQLSFGSTCCHSGFFCCPLNSTSFLSCSCCCIVLLLILSLQFLLADAVLLVPQVVLLIPDAVHQFPLIVLLVPVDALLCYFLFCSFFCCCRPCGSCCCRCVSCCCP